jgi:phosphotriesterase-related protein
MTVLGPISPEALGPTYMHEHVIVDNSWSGDNPLKKLDEIDTLTWEMKDVLRAGARTIVDLTCVGLGPNPAGLKQIAEASGINIVTSTGVYRPIVWPEYVAASTVEELARRWIDECEHGFAGTDVRPGVLAEFGSNEKDAVPEDADKVFQAACMTQQATGIPISTHCGLRDCDWQVAAFKRHGALLDKVVLGHMMPSDRSSVAAGLSNPQMAHLKRILDTGVNVGIDTVGYGERDGQRLLEHGKAHLAKTFVEWGHLEQVTVSCDMTRKYHLKKYGGHGFALLMDWFAPLLREVGLSDEQVDQIMIENPRRILTPAP